VRVILCRQVGGRHYARRWELPLPPFPGLWLQLEPGGVVSDVADVLVTSAGEVVVELGLRPWDRAGDVEGWVPCRPGREAEALAEAEAGLGPRLADVGPGLPVGADDDDAG
jgi:hypothetical protein